MKKLFGALIAGSLMFGAVMASAATMPVTGGSLQVNTVSATCQTDTIHVGYTTLLTGSNVNAVKTVEISGINDACIGAQLTVNLKDQVGPPSGQVWYYWGTITGSTLSLNSMDHNATYPPVADVANVDVMIAAK